MPLATRQYTDLNLSLAIHPIKKDIIPLVNADAINQSLKALILTKHYERPFHPEIGCIVTSLLFEPVNAMTSALIQRSIQDVITNFEPRVLVQQILVDVRPDQNSYSVQVVYSIKNNPNPLVFTTFLERAR